MSMLRDLVEQKWDCVSEVNAGIQDKSIEVMSEWAKDDIAPGECVVFSRGGPPITLKRYASGELAFWAWSLDDVQGAPVWLPQLIEDRATRVRLLADLVVDSVESDLCMVEDECVAAFQL